MILLNKLNERAFTILETLLAVLVVGIIAGFAIPSYTKSLERAEEQDIINQLKLIHSAQNYYLAKNGDYIPTYTDSQTALQNINAALGLSIISNGAQYYSLNRTIGASKDYTINVTPKNGAYVISLLARPWNPKYTSPAGNPLCSGPCPSLK